MGLLLGLAIVSLKNPIWLVLGATTGFLLGRRHINLGWSSFVMVWLGYIALYYMHPNPVTGFGIYAYLVVVGVAFLFTRFLSEPTEADDS